MTDQGKCGSCGAGLKSGADWCGLCYAKVDQPEPPRTFAHADAFIGPPVNRNYSRWAKSDVSYGPVGRVVATMVLCVVPIWWGVMFSWVLAGLWIFVAAPMLLRAIWKRTPVVPR